MRTIIDVSYRNLAVLPELQQGVKDLYCWSNQLTKLPPLPQTLHLLSCSYNLLTTLPRLPLGLDLLYCWNNQIRYIEKYIIVYNCNTFINADNNKLIKYYGCNTKNNHALKHPNYYWIGYMKN